DAAQEAFLRLGSLVHFLWRLAEGLVRMRVAFFYGTLQCAGGLVYAAVNRGTHLLDVIRQVLRNPVYLVGGLILALCERLVELRANAVGDLCEAFVADVHKVILFAVWLGRHIV